MKTVKPFRLSILTRPYRWQRRDTLGVSVLAMFSLGADPKLMPEQELWQVASEELDPGCVLDLGLPKLAPEMLASGYCYTAHQDDKTRAAAGLRVAGLERSLLVHGDRYWLDGRSTSPQPFDRMRMDWRHAYGGADLADNPMGIGRSDEIVNGVRTRRLPNVVVPGRDMSAPDQPVAPASLAGMPPDWPQRMKLMGSAYGKGWVENDFPGLASDVDWHFLNAAAPEQRWPDASALPLGAPYEITNMHPREPVLRGFLPDWTARCFASFRQDGAELAEIALRPTTVWFFPHLERAVLVWHGGMPIAEDDAADVKHIMPALELPDAPRPLAHYQEVLRRRIDPAQAIHVVRDSDLVPKSVLGEWEAAKLFDPWSRPTARNMRAGQQREYDTQRAQLVAMGLEPDDYLPRPPDAEILPDLDDMPDYTQRVQERIEDSVRSRKQLEADNEARRQEAGFDAEPTPGAPASRFDPDAFIREIERADDFAREAGGAAAAPMFSAQQRAQMIERVHRSYLHAAHLSDPAPAPTSFRAAKIRRRLESAPPGERRFARMNLIGANLSGMDLRGADFSGAMLEDADLSGARLDGCDFSQAVLARANLSGAIGPAARFDGANLGAARCVGSDFSGASFVEANFDKATLESSVFAGATFERTGFHESVLRQCDLRRTRWMQVPMFRLQLDQLVFDEADFSRVVWLECRMADVSFAGAKLVQCGFVSLDGGAGIAFSEARLEACSFAHGSSLPGALFRAASLTHCGLRGAGLAGADFTQARLDGCDFSACDLRGARLERMAAGESLFVRADLSGASLRGANLIDANLSKSNLLGADLAQANLFRADVSQALLDGTTHMDGAYTQHAKVWPARGTGGGA